ncbi:MAG: type II toxin-antitoxin system VapC family toxin [Thermoleophilaceae bacterium]|nr:type II toxin-antitoxin system VapC family toxin [Thermoleophilaceae bacterium]
MSGAVCLDSWAVLEWLDGNEPAAERVELAMKARQLMSWLNAVEVYYRIERDHGRSEADEVINELKTSVELDLPTTARCIAAARIKTGNPIALADCFAVATAAARGLPLLTGDPEIIDARDLPCEIEDIRA